MTHHDALQLIHEIHTLTAVIALVALAIVLAITLRR